MRRGFSAEFEKLFRQPPPDVIDRSAGLIRIVLENKRHFLGVSGDFLERVDPINDARNNLPPEKVGSPASIPHETFASELGIVTGPSPLPSLYNRASSTYGLLNRRYHMRWALDNRRCALSVVL